MQRLILLLLATLAFLTSPATAAGPAAEMWRVSQKSGDVRVIHNRLQPAAARVDAALSPGDVVMTGPTGRATLVRGGDYIVIAPGSRLLLPASPPQNGMTSLIQEVGTMLFKVRRTGVPHFRVDTPMLAAVVKGTTFTVIVGESRSAVQVIEGAVEVSAAQGGMSRLVEGGKTVFIANDNPSMLITADGATLQKTSAAPGVSVKLGGTGDLDLGAVANLSDGLVRADLTATPIKTVAAIAPVVASSTGVSNAVTGTVNGVVAGVAESASASGAAAVATTATAVVTGVVETVAATPVATLAGSVAPTVTGVTTAVVGPVVTTLATIPTVTAPTVTVPTVTAPTVTTPTVTTPIITVPTVTVPVVTVPTVTVPTVTVPVVTVPVVTVPVVTVPVVTVPVVTVPTTPCIGC